MINPTFTVHVPASAKPSVVHIVLVAVGEDGAPCVRAFLNDQHYRDFSLAGPEPEGDPAADGSYIPEAPAPVDLSDLQTRIERPTEPVHEPDDFPQSRG